MKSLKLPADLRIQSATALRDRLSVALEGSGPLRLQGGAVARLDTAGLQLLAAAAQEATRRGRELRLAAPSAPLAEGLERLGLDDFFSHSDKQGGRARSQGKN
ncbi:STAS domain-containing protein [Wenzhouxiangella sp. XN24]|uniref:STAS domain-containing protein n=1 Tax=Wenzhouxiangella sp. XN24 TaxID=2713569 RepID=UPI0013EAAAA7|nr:STAS domain-containing protein [Wenzhouxiangella sp. XN24]NGX16204.1 STAS domain-containing protein [Wenzhouxiangella sp. XN24]